MQLHQTDRAGGRRLIREMDDHRTVDVKGQRVVPNDFKILLAADDHAGFADIEDALRTELVEAVREYAARRATTSWARSPSICGSTTR